MLQRGQSSLLTYLYFHITLTIDVIHIIAFYLIPIYIYCICMVRGDVCKRPITTVATPTMTSEWNHSTWLRVLSRGLLRVRTQRYFWNVKCKMVCPGWTTRMKREIQIEAVNSNLIFLPTIRRKKNHCSLSPDSFYLVRESEASPPKQILYEWGIVIDTFILSSSSEKVEF